MLENITFANPEFFWLLLLLPLAVLWYFYKRREQVASLKMPTIKGFSGSGYLPRLKPFLFILRLVAFAGEAYTKTPITSDKAIVLNALREITYGELNDGTAIGMGLATAVNRLKESKAVSKIIILLTDGVNNSGFIEPQTAADLAVEYGIKTYTIGIGSNGNALTPIAYNADGSFRYGMSQVEIDEPLLKDIAKVTGGKYFRATDNEKLEAIYEEINKLEKRI